MYDMEQKSTEINEKVAVLLRENADGKWCRSCLGKLTIVKDKNLLRCTTKKCRKTQKLFINDYMNNLNVKHTLIVHVVELWFLGASSNLIKTYLKIHKDTLVKIKEALGLALNNFFENENMSIGGENIIVEIDESKFGKRKYNQGHVVEGVWVLGLVERTEARKIVLVEIPNRTADTLNYYITKYVKPGSIIHTDLWRGYAGLAEFDYTHFTVNHSLNYVDPLTGCHTNTIEGNWSGVKKMVSANNRCAGKIQIYLQLYMFKRVYGDETLDLIIKSLFA